jgi:hypothetical protein
MSRKSWHRSWAPDSAWRGPDEACGQPQILKRRTPTGDYVILAHAWKIANDKATELGWVDRVRPRARTEQCYSSRFTTDSMRRSGTNHMSAIATYNTTAIHGLTNARGIATTYPAMDNLPFRSLPTATASVELRPLEATIAHWSRW